MGKLINILAASIGGGLVLGAGIRLGEAIASQIPASGPDTGRKLAERLGELENRLQSFQHPHVTPAMPAEAVPPAAVPPEADGDRQIEALGEANLRGELRSWLEASLAAKMTEVEARLRAESERSRKQILDAFAESVQTRVIQRISKLEEEVAGQSAAMGELRDCSLRTELSIQKLLGGLDSLIVKSPPVSEDAATRDPDPPPVTDREEELYYP